MCLTGCSYIVTGRVVHGPTDRSHLPHIDPNDPNCPVSIEWITEPNKPPSAVISPREGVPANKISGDLHRIAYADNNGFWSNPPEILLNGTLADSGKEYEIQVDTGSPYPLLVNDLHVRENHLPIYEIEGKDQGICLLPDIHIGSMTLRRPVSVYHWYHFEGRLLGLRVYRPKAILLGVPFLRAFKYVSFDGAGRQAEFSRAESFDPADPNEWSRYPFAESSAPDAETRIHVEIPIAGQTLRVAFDTGYQGALLTSQGTWQQMQQGLSGVRTSRKKLYGPHLGGRISATMATVKRLQVGSRVGRNAHVAALPDDSPLIQSLGDVDGILGLQCLTDTTIVLDFEREAMWVRNDGTL